VTNRWGILLKKYVEETVEHPFFHEDISTRQECFDDLEQFVTLRRQAGHKIKTLRLMWEQTEQEFEQESPGAFDKVIFKDWQKKENQILQWNLILKQMPYLERLDLSGDFDAPFLVMMQLIYHACVECKQTLKRIDLPLAPWRLKTFQLKREEWAPCVIARTEFYHEVMCACLESLSSLPSQKLTYHHTGIKQLCLFEGSIDPSMLLKLAQVGSTLTHLEGISLIKLGALEYEGINQKTVRDAWYTFCEKCTNLEKFTWFASEFLDKSYYVTFGKFPRPALKKLIFNFESIELGDSDQVRYGKGMPLRSLENFRQILHQREEIQDDDLESSLIPDHFPNPPFLMNDFLLEALQNCHFLQELYLSFTWFNFQPLNDFFLEQIMKNCPLLKSFSIDKGDTDDVPNFINEEFDERSHMLLIEKVTDHGFIHFINGLQQLTRVHFFLRVPQLTWKSLFHLIQIATCRGFCMDFFLQFQDFKEMEQMIPFFLEKILHFVSTFEKKNKQLAPFCIILQIRKGISWNSRQKKIRVWSKTVENWFKTKQLSQKWVKNFEIFDKKNQYLILKHNCSTIMDPLPDLYITENMIDRDMGI
jgi:hypothetical protein